MPLLHNLKEFVLGSCSLAYRLVRHPVLSARLVFRMPMTLRGYLAGDQWPAPHAVRGKPGADADDGQPDESPNPLTQFFDSRKQGRGIWKWRHYFDIYHHHLSRFVGREVRLLEIGVHSGGSLEMWKHYLGPKCQIYGIDREVACKVYEDERTKIFVGDQGDQAFWKRLKDEVPIVDIVVDDGGHHPEHQLLTLQEMLPHLSAGGIYICEDVHGVSNRFTAYVYGLVDQLNAFVQTAPGALDCQATRFQELVRSIHLYPYVIVIETVVRPNSRLVCERHGTEWQPF